MIEAVLTPLLLVFLAGVAGWRSGHRSSGVVWRVLRRVRAGVLLVRGRSPLCDTCRPRVGITGACYVLCERCDPIVLAFLAVRRDRVGRPRPVRDT